MNILYIHGLDSSPNPDRMAYMEKKGHKVYGLHLDYMNQPASYQILKDFVGGKKIEAIVGSSLGGYLGFWLSEEMGLPCLLFNPAMFVSKPEANIPDFKQRDCDERYVVLGELDDRVNPEENWSYFTKLQNTLAYQRVMKVLGLGHEIDLDTFKDSFNWVGW